MRKVLMSAVVLTAMVIGARDAAAQDVVITNARIVVGNGTVIDQGSIVVRGGRIASVAAGRAAAPAGAQTIDAHGMSAVPGFIDGHRHINTGPNEKAQMQALLDAGYTTILSGGGPADGNLTLKDHIDKGVINGPRIIPSGSVRLNAGADAARAEIRRLAGLGIKYTGEISITPRPGPTVEEMDTLKAILDEANKVGIYVQVHAVSPQAMMAAVDAGVKKLVHTPHFGWLSMDDAKKVAAAGVKQLSTTGFGVPVFGVFANDNTPRFRDGKPWPESIIDGEGRGREAGYKAVNARTSFDAGVIYGYGTDTGYEPRAGLAQELRTLNLMFSPQDIVKVMGPNSASYIEMSDQLGTLEAGKLADIVLVDGNPLEGYWNLLNTKVVLKEGKIVADRR